MSINEKMTALADAIRRKTGGTDLLSIDEMAAAVTALEAGGLPEGWATGEFNTTEETMNGAFAIEHGLGVIPNFIFIWSTAPELVEGQWRCYMHVSVGEEYWEDENDWFPAYMNEYGFRDTGTSITNAQGGIDFDASRTAFCVPSSTRCNYFPTTTFKWLAIVLEG